MGYPLDSFKVRFGCMTNTQLIPVPLVEHFTRPHSPELESLRPIYNRWECLAAYIQMRSAKHKPLELWETGQLCGRSGLWETSQLCRRFGLWETGQLCGRFGLWETG